MDAERRFFCRFRVRVGATSRRFWQLQRKDTNMQPRGSRLACSLYSIDGSIGSFDVFPAGDAPKSIARVDPVKWATPPQKEVRRASFSIVGEMGMTGAVLVLNQYKWRALASARLEEPFYAMILWRGSSLKVHRGCDCDGGKARWLNGRCKFGHNASGGPPRIAAW